VDEVKFSISEKGLELKAVDPANVAMVSLRIRAEAFDFFKADQGEIGVDLVRLSDVLSMADKGENVQLELDEESHKLKIGVGSLSYTLSLIDPSAIRKEPRIPELDLPAHVTLPGAELRRAVKGSRRRSAITLCWASQMRDFTWRLKGTSTPSSSRYPALNSWA